MELSKGYCVKLTLVAMVVAIVCLVAIVLLGLFPVIREKKRLKPQPRIAQALDFRR